MEKKVRLRDEPAFATAQALLWALSDRGGPVRNDLSRCLLDSALDELNGLYEVGQWPAQPVKVTLDGPQAGRHELDDALEQLLIWSADLGDALRVVRTQELAAQAWREFDAVGEHV